MKPQTEKVLNALRKAKSKGISFHSVMFSRSLAKRICEIIDAGYKVARISEYNGRYNYRRYVLEGDKK